MLIDLITNSESYRKYRNEIKEVANRIGWSKFKKYNKIENKRKRFFHIVEIYLHLPLYLKRETERWLYFDIVTRRACRHLPQIKIEKLIYEEVKGNLLRSPIYISIQNEFCLRGDKFFNGDFYISDTTQILIAKQNKLINPNVALKFIFAGPYSGKEVTSGAWAESYLKAEKALFKKIWSATSLTGAHWEDFHLIITPVETDIEIRHICHGKKKLRWDTTNIY